MWLCEKESLLIIYWSMNSLPFFRPALKSLLLFFQTMSKQWSRNNLYSNWDAFGCNISSGCSASTVLPLCSKEFPECAAGEGDSGQLVASHPFFYPFALLCLWCSSFRSVRIIVVHYLSLRLTKKKSFICPWRASRPDKRVIWPVICNKLAFISQLLVRLWCNCGHKERRELSFCWRSFSCHDGRAK